jgi:phage repressor protein C with HTH and peptisase S24 domain
MEVTTTQAQEILERLKSCTNSKSDTELAKTLGLSQQSISSARNNCKIPDSWIHVVSKQFRISTDWLFFGVGQPTLDAIAPDAISPFDETLKMIPLVGARLSAGQGSFETSGQIERSYAFRKTFLNKLGIADRMVLMTVSGDSMEPEIKNGDMVLIDQSQQTLYPGKIFAVGVEDMVFLKRVTAIPGKVILSSVNSAYPPIEIDTRGDLASDVRIVGQAVWSCREL